MPLCKKDTGAESHAIDTYTEEVAKVASRIYQAALCHTVATFSSSLAKSHEVLVQFLENT